MTVLVNRPKLIVPVRLLVGLAIFAYVLFFTYKLKVAPLFTYSGLTFREPDPLSYAGAIGMAAVVAFALPRSVRKVSDFILWVFFILGVAPSILLAQYSQTLAVTEANRLGLAISGTTLAVVFLSAHIPQASFRVKRLEKGSTFWVLLAMFSVFVYAFVIAQTGLSFRFLAFADVYGVRSEFGEASSGSVVIAYLLPVQINVVNPLFMIKGILSRRFWLLAIGLVGQLIIYSTGGQKSTFFSVFAIFGIALLYRNYKSRSLPGAAILFAITATSLAAILADRVGGGFLWTSLISRRVLIVPGALAAAYVKVFHDRPRQHFAEVLPFVTNPYQGLHPANIVGEEFGGDPTTVANVSLFGHGYLQFGYLGMFVEGGVLVVLLILANSATRDLPLVVSCVAFFGATLALVSASIFTTILSHGVLAAILVCAIAPSSGWHRPKSEGADEQDLQLRQN